MALLMCGNFVDEMKRDSVKGFYVTVNKQCISVWKTAVSMKRLEVDVFDSYVHYI